jgi:hypothetical protein
MILIMKIITMVMIILDMKTTMKVTKEITVIITIKTVIMNRENKKILNK